jgi:subtilisin-like proprotein convertase family protein
MATPHVSGVAALAWSVAPNATRQQIRNAVLAGTDPMASLAGKVATGGRLNAKGTLDQLGSAPVVDVTATDANAAEQGLDPGTFTITRSGSTSSALTVYYAIGGSATNGVDYNALSGSLTISAGATSGVVTVKPIDDTLVETSETVILTLSSSASYKIGTHSSATVVIADNDMPSRTYTSGNVPKTIPDRSMIVSTLTVPDSITISDLNVTVNISHTYDADLDVFLSAPDGTRVELFTDVGGSGDNFANTTLDDEASKSITSGVAPFAGSYRPEGLLSRFDGKNAKGTWVLWVTDDARYDTGRLNSWSISILGQVTATQSQTSSQSTPSNGRRLTSSSAGMLGDLFDVAAVSSLAAIGENSSNLPLGGASQAGGMRFADHGADTPLDPGFSSSVLGGRGTGSGVSFLGTIGQVTPDSGARRFLAQEGNETFGQKGQGTDARALPGTIRRQGPSNFAAGPGGVLGAPHDIVLSSNLEEAVGLLAVRPLGEE